MPSSPPLMDDGSATNEEYIEQLVEEKWNSLVQDVNKIVEWKTKTEEDITSMKQQFEDLRASELYCPRCKGAQPVRERLLLVLPHSELHDYRCTVCGESVGSREVKAPPVLPPGAVPAAAPTVVALHTHPFFAGGSWHGFIQGTRAGRDVVQQPVVPSTHRRIRVIDDERQALCAWRQLRPG